MSKRRHVQKSRNVKQDGEDNSCHHILFKQTGAAQLSVSLVVGVRMADSLEENGE